MADISLTPALVIPSGDPSSQIKRGVAGAVITAGQPLYADAQDNKKLKLAEADGAEAQAKVVGLSLTGAGVGQPVLYLAEDPDFDLGVTVASGRTVVLSATAGALCPDADIVSGSRKVIIGVGKGGTKINLKVLAGGVV